LLSAAMPMLGIYTILAQKHGHEEVAAAALLATTVVSFITLSALLWVLRVTPGWLG
jgi:malonate transporter and related proteins